MSIVTNPQQTSNKRIVVIEDDRDIRESITEVLETEGYQVTTASNGEEGLKILDTSARPGLILLDLMMPVKDGFQFWEDLSKLPELSTIPIVIMSAAGRMDEKRTRIPAREYLRKPIELDQLLTTVEKHIGT